MSKWRQRIYIELCKQVFNPYLILYPSDNETPDAKCETTGRHL